MVSKWQWISMIYRNYFILRFIDMEMQYVILPLSWRSLVRYWSRLAGCTPFDFQDSIIGSLEQILLLRFSNCSKQLWRLKTSEVFPPNNGTAVAIADADGRSGGGWTGDDAPINADTIPTRYCWRLHVWLFMHVCVYDIEFVHVHM